ncbi:methionine gamma-lyase [Anaeroselena agilis]|uniref:L-methionine gamma-lyase n=1 Tax=Anaeroselena agilis TaxID=3063788 RepID=A0ABU3NZ03_9FIRM|nr:methionine gamma-lyase [Selenomonadales bacterium 4137-cl]
MKEANQGFGTIAIHAGNAKDKSYGALTAPICQSSTFVFDDCAQGGRRFAGAEGGFIYTRLGNPTTAMLETKLAALEGAEAAAVTSSGMGAISAVFWTVCRAGVHVIADSTLYGCTYALLSHGLTRFGVEVSFVDTADIAQVKAALRDNTVAIYLETPANPTLKITDIRQVCDVAHNFNKNIRVICDNTFATPYLQTPLALGCDIVVHSATKYINGHGDVVAGAALGANDFISELKLFGIKDMTGSVISPHDAYLVLRGLKTLEIRMDRHCANAKIIARYLSENPKVTKVYFPGLETHPGHAIAQRQMKDFGGMISFEVKGGKEAGINLLDNLDLCTLAVSLGDAETLIEHPASMTHSTYTAAELKKAGVPEGLVRISVGLENPQDIIADLERGFSRI